MVVTRSRSGATKKAAETKVVERASKKTAAVRERPSKKLRPSKELSAEGDRASNAEQERKVKWMDEEYYLYTDAFSHFLMDKYYPEYYAKHPDIVPHFTKNNELAKSGFAEWKSMTRSEKAPYHAKVKRLKDEWKAAAALAKKGFLG